MNSSTGTSTILMLKNKYGLDIGSAHVIVGETPSRLHWLLQGGKHVNKERNGVDWEWIARDDTTVGQKRKTAPNGERFELGRVDEGSEAQKSLWEKRLRCDVTLHSSDTVVPAHSAVLVRWSKFFSRHFESTFADSRHAEHAHARVGMLYA